MPIHVRLEWPVTPDTAPVTSEAGERLAAYVTRWAQTLSVSVYDAAFVENRMELIVELPPALSLDGVTVPLREASARFARETLKLAAFTWVNQGVRADSIAAVELSGAAGKANANDETPAWLKDAIAQGKGTGK